MQKSISGSTDVALFSPGDGVNGVTSLHIANTHEANDVIVDVYISTVSSAGVAASTFYLMKGRRIEKGGYTVLESKALSFDNTTAAGFGLFIKLNAKQARDLVDTRVDVLISK